MQPTTISTEVDIIHLVTDVTDSDVKLLQAAADPTRLAILRQLSSEGPTCACDVVAEGRGLSQSTISHHLRVLRESGWIEGERRGTWIWYSVRQDASERFRDIARSIKPGVARPTSGLGPVRSPRRGLEVIQSEWRQW
jgi:ArsR family transcriptional regulator, arsenate/arsenite/antimonite-responsive transcriptional repressor